MIISTESARHKVRCNRRNMSSYRHFFSALSCIFTWKWLICFVLEKPRYTECVSFEPGHPDYLALGSPERLLVKIFSTAIFIPRNFCFSPFSLSLTWLAVAGPPFIILSWPPTNLRHGDFRKSFVMAKKSLSGFRKLSGRSTMTRPWWECTCKWFFKWRIRRNHRRWRRIRGPWTRRLPSPISGPKWRMTDRRVSGNSLRPMMFRLKRFMTLTTRICSFQKVGPFSDQKVYYEMKKERVRTTWCL